MQSKKKNSRRDFIKQTAVGLSVFSIVPRHVLGGVGFVAPSDKVNIGIVGAGGQSMYSIKQLLNLDDVQLTTIADPAYIWHNDILYRSDTGRGPSKEFIEKFYSEKTPNYRMTEYQDFRDMLKKEKALDAIVCASPDNTHAYISINAMRAGKHVYCEKPLTHNIWEARKVLEVAKETKLATQMGNQLHNTEGLRQTVEYLRAGVIGKVHEAHSWVGATRWLPHLDGFPEGFDGVPAGFDWNLWLGPSAWRPYNKVYTPVKWRDFWTFGDGALGDFGCHDMDTVTWAFNLQAPESVQVFPAGNRGSVDIAPYGEIGYYQFAASDDHPPLKLTWYSGGLHPAVPDLLPKDIQFGGRGAMYVGDKGILLSNEGPSGKPQIFPESLQNSFTPPAPSLPRTQGHHREWVDAIKGGPAALSNFEYGARLTENVLLGVLSLRLGGKKIYWDAANMKATGLPEADEIIREPVRAGWEMV
jgi:predicted dehydrogenase